MLKKIKIILAVAIPIILVVGGMGWYLFGWFSPPSVEVNDGYTQVNLTLECKPGHSVSPNKNISAITLIDNGTGRMILTVDFISYSFAGSQSASYGFSGRLIVNFMLYAEVNLPPSLKPSGFKFVAGMPDNGTDTVNFDTSFNYGINATAWPDDKIDPGAWAPHSAYIGFTPHSSNFMVKSHIEYWICNLTPLESHTLRIKAVLLGYNNPVVATVDLVLKGVWK